MQQQQQQHHNILFPPSPPHPTHSQNGHYPNGLLSNNVSPIQSQSSALLQTRVLKTNSQFTTQFIGISGFTCHPGVPTLSPDIELNDRIWRLILFPGGVDEACKGNISCFLQCLSPGSTRAAYRFSVVNQMGWKNHSLGSDQARIFKGIDEIDDSANLYIHENDLVFGVVEQDMLMKRNHSLLPCHLHGEDKFLSWNEIKQTTNGHCVDDCLIIRVDLIVYGDIEKVVLSSPSPFLAICRHFDASALPRRSNGVAQATLSNIGNLNEVPTAVQSPTHNPYNSFGRQVANETVSTISSSPIFPFLMLKDQLAMMFDDRSSSDFVVKVKSTMPSNIDDITENGIQCKCIYLHKFILSLRSPVFKAMFHNCVNMRESNSNELIINEHRSCDHVIASSSANQDFFVSYESLHEFFFFLYTDTCHINDALPQHAQELLALACKYQVEGLRYICEHYLSTMLTPSNVLILLETADTFGSEGLKTKALAYIAQNLKTILITPTSAASDRLDSRTTMSDLLATLHPRLCMEVLQAVAGVHPFQLQSSHSIHNANKDDSIFTTSRRSRAGSRLHEESVVPATVLLEQPHGNPGDNTVS